MDEGCVRLCIVDGREIVRAGLVVLLYGVDGIAVTAAVGSASALPIGAVDVAIVGAEDRLTDVVRTARIRGAAVLALVDRATPEAVSRATGAGATEVVEQTADRAALVAAVRRVAGGRRGAASRDRRVAPVGPPDACLNRTERQVLALYAAGLKADAVARSIGLSASTVTTYVSRIRRKYERVGRVAGARVDLYHRAVEDGLLPRTAAIA